MEVLAARQPGDWCVMATGYQMVQLTSCLSRSAQHKAALKPQPTTGIMCNWKPGVLMFYARSFYPKVHAHVSMMVVVNMNRNQKSFLFKGDYNGDIVIRPMTQLAARPRSARFPYVHCPEWRGAEEVRQEKCRPGAFCHYQYTTDFRTLKNLAIDHQQAFVFVIFPMARVTTCAKAKHTLMVVLTVSRPLNLAGPRIMIVPRDLCWPRSAAAIMTCGHQCQKKFHPKVRNHGEGPYQGLLLVESGYYRFHI